MIIKTVSGGSQFIIIKPKKLNMKQPEFKIGVGNNIRARKGGKRLRWAGLAGAVALLLASQHSSLACGSWGGVTTTNTPAVNLTGSNSGNFYSWYYSVSGSGGSYSGSAAASSFNQLIAKATVGTGVQTASGYKQDKMGGWTSGGAGHHGAPGDAKVTGQGDGTAQGTIHMDANNWDIDAGSCAALAYAKITFSGVASGSAEINLNGTFAEGATTISGTLSADPSVTISTTCSGDIADAQGVNTVSVSLPFVGNIAGQLQKGHGTCSVRARVNNGANSASADASTSIGTCTLTQDYGGSGGPCPELCEAHTH